ncbi:hypothetical protein [Kibdelosporangium phytohabitans]|uniref:Uncharacterized protein n=1 Tax=Kibdelosporangium phytohabitans TaxID=860235 RepID=A0A0N9HWC6_9PSEU|nr:hypothetical protein [Kibdelosporangium phytohabitans]ALG06386.1 hypothetical protein AOZ06_05105 [Kibdelosporangium phytohabitans]MBE1467533.1 hypothetical protein [Kibdelosporangium phytohabitans]
MGGFLSELGKNLAKQWVSLLVVPGCLFIATVAFGLALGHRRWWEVSRATKWVTTIDTGPRGVGVLTLVLVVLLITAAAAGLLAQAIGTVVERLWLAQRWERWPRPIRAIAAAVTRVRAGRWTGHPDAAPRRPTWIGDRALVPTKRVHAAYRMDLPVVWPALWLHLPDNTRAEITSARLAYSTSAALAGWGVLYVAAAAVWWPALLVVIAVWITAWVRARQSIDTYARLIEAAVHLHSPDLARVLGFEQEGPLTRDTGARLTYLLSARNDHHTVRDAVLEVRPQGPTG